jgi:hypothetical protein
MPAPKRPLPPPNPVTYANHRRQVFWQIYFPLIIIVSLVLFAGIGVLLASVSGSGSEAISRWGDISLIWLISPMLVLILISFVALCGMVYLLWQILKVLPSYTRQLLEFFLLVQIRVRKASDAAASPFIHTHSFMASVRRGLRR